MCGYHRTKREIEQLDKRIVIPKELYKLEQKVCPKKRKCNGETGVFQVCGCHKVGTVTLKNQILGNNMISEHAEMNWNKHWCIKQRYVSLMSSKFGKYITELMHVISGANVERSGSFSWLTVWGLLKKSKCHSRLYESEKEATVLLYYTLSNYT